MFGLFSDNNDKCKCCNKSLDGLRVETKNGKKFCSKQCVINWVKKMTGAT